MMRSSKEISDKLSEYYRKRGVLREQELEARPTPGLVPCSRELRAHVAICDNLLRIETICSTLSWALHRD